MKVPIGPETDYLYIIAVSGDFLSCALWQFSGIVSYQEFFAGGLAWLPSTLVQDS